MEGIQAPQGHTRLAFARHPAWLAVPTRKGSSVCVHYIPNGIDWLSRF